MSIQPATAQDSNHWKHIVVRATNDENAFEQALDDRGADGFEIVTYTFHTTPTGAEIYSALMRRRADSDEQIVIQQRHRARARAVLDES